MEYNQLNQDQYGQVGLGRTETSSLITRLNKKSFIKLIAYITLLGVGLKYPTCKACLYILYNAIHNIA
jgi:hypothetical protein